MRVLYWGNQEWTPIPYYRGGQFRPWWPALGVEAGYVRYDQFPLAAQQDWAPIEWADVVVFRRWYQDPTTPLAWERAAAKARVYDTDDWDFGTPPKIPHRHLILAHLDLVRQMAREADVVTVATPRLAAKYAPYARRPPIVLRNAVDLDLYAPDPGEPDRPTAVFYGSRARLADYFGAPDHTGRWRGGYAHAAVTEARLPIVWMGDEGAGTTIPREFARIVPFSYDLRDFARALANTRAVVGVAPLSGDEFDMCKSELHWLDYSAAGIPSVAERASGGGPYSVIRDGVDGLLARGHEQWRRAVGRLAREPALRTDLVAAARERLVAEYDPGRRAAEWVDAFRLALA